MAAPASSSVVPQQEHRGINQSIDTLYIETVAQSAMLQTYLCKPVGAIRFPFLNFYTPFVALFRMTYKQKELKADEFKTVSEDIQKWLVPSNQITADKCIKGIALFDEWQAALFKSGLLSVRK